MHFLLKKNIQNAKELNNISSSTSLGLFSNQSLHSIDMEGGMIL